MVIRITRFRVALAALAVLALFAVRPLGARVRAAGILTALAQAEPEKVSAERLLETELTLPSDQGPIRARLYRSGPAARGSGIVVAHGVHYRSIDEPRLVRFSRQLAASGSVVLTPELKELADYHINAQGIAAIDASVRWLSAKDDLVTSPRVGLIGFSFAGGLAMVSATEPSVQARLGYVASVGGHHDLERVLRFLLHDEIATPSGLVHTKAHEYGLVVLLYQELEQFVDAEDLPAMRDAVRAWLGEDRKTSATAAARCRTASAERIYRLLETSHLAELTPALEERVRLRGPELRALSPHGHLATIHVPVYALHGAGDTVIPPSETAWLEREAEESGADHRMLVTPLLEHVSVAGHAKLSDQWALVDLIGRLL
jgi:dienelactone hydrolase